MKNQIALFIPPYSGRTNETRSVSIFAKMLLQFCKNKVAIFAILLQKVRYKIDCCNPCKICKLQKSIFAKLQNACKQLQI
jgi:hypothetical protein